MGLQLPRAFGLSSHQTVNHYEYLADKRVLFLYGPMIEWGPILGIPGRNDLQCAHIIADEMIALDSLSHDPIWLVIESPGGQIAEGFLLMDVMNNIASPVYTVARSCSSMATVLFSAGEPGHRYIFPHSKCMLHLPSGSASGDVNLMGIRMKEMTKIKEELIALLIEYGAKKTRTQILRDINREIYFSAKEIIEYGLADAIVTPDVMRQISQTKPMLWGEPAEVMTQLEKIQNMSHTHKIHEDAQPHTHDENDTPGPDYIPNNEEDD